MGNSALKKESPIESIYNLNNYIKDDNYLPIYFLFGEDSFTINNALKMLEKKFAPLVESDFDRESITLNKESSISQFVDFAYSFPFSGGKKLITVKNFESINDKKSFANYVNDPSDFTILLVTQYSKSAGLRSEPYKSLFAKKYIFEARELSGAELSRWMFNKAKTLNLNLSREAGELLLEMVGENKGILEMQLQKISTYVTSEEEISPDIIRNLSEKTKEYTIFDLQNAIGKGEKEKAIDYAFNLLNSGTDMVFIIAMLTKFVGNFAKILKVKSVPEGVKTVGGSYYFMQKMPFFRNKNRIIKSAKALLEADIRLKTSNIDSKTNITILISEMLN